ncbi:hypothetical protein QF032_007725 [Streptomyces achromogenes]|uniref:Uncharacterized protein n=1 Tax=Streptomyces achromogenes TaxID=67255 RepID=A0ABU0QDE7_STRAH|nr:hypothetical protein [Streptomyces achromogenes]MDQ0835881.1 hypothetical protein [Streptomyces achromogenes]
MTDASISWMPLPVKPPGQALAHIVSTVNAAGNAALRAAYLDRRLVGEPLWCSW